MKVTGVLLNNFASYEFLSFVIDRQGPVLIHGPTGSGKSTLCDAIPWILFGKTAKDGTADEVLSWTNKSPTTGMLTLSDGTVVVRKRGKGANDLYIQLDGVLFRGKDLADTQKRINEYLGFTAETYLAGAYYHEFSQTAQFFTTTAKSRRVLCEQLVDLSFATKLQLEAATAKKAAKTTLLDLDRELAKNEGRITTLESAVRYSKQDAEEWERSFAIKRENELNKLKVRRDELESGLEDGATLYERLRNIKQLKKDIQVEICPTCGGPKNSDDLKALNEGLMEATTKVHAYELRKQQISDVNSRIKAVEAQSTVNMHLERLGKAKKELKQFKGKQTELQSEILNVKELVGDIEVLFDIIEQFRSVTIQNTILRLQTTTNDYLTKHFDAEIRVEFEATTADKLEVTIHKDGNVCTYTQLSKGQRCLLKLCFGAAAMQTVSERYGVKFEQLFFDEALDGLDDVLKVKAYGLLQSLPAQAVYVVEHSSALKMLFNTQYQVSLTEQGSVIENL